MINRATESSLADGTTLRSGSVVTPVPHAKFAKVGVGNSGDNRSYGRFSYDTMKSGHKDSKNTALTIPMTAVHTLRHSNLNNRNPGDSTRHMGDKAYQDRRIFRRAYDYYLGDAVMGDEMKEVVTRLDPSSHVNAVTVDEFQHGGSRQDAVRATMIGAGASVPVDNLDGTNLNNSYGLHYSVDIGPGKGVADMQRQSKENALVAPGGKKNMPGIS